MAKGNLFLGQARGKVGSVVFARAFGEQITRTRPTSVSNPKSYAQNVQRAILATIAKEAALLTPIVDHSFANISYGAASVRYFRKVNMGILRNRFLGGTINMNLSAKGAGAVPNALKISEGSLPSFSTSYQSDVVSFYQNGALQNRAEVPVSTFRQAYPYLQGGDQLTLVKLVKTAGTLEDGDAAFAMKVDRMVFAPNAFDDDSAEMITEEGFINEARLDLTKTTNKVMLAAMSGGGGNGLSATTDDDNTYAAALILSRKVNNVWQRSTQYLEMTGLDDWTDIATAIESYGASSSLADATEYLNQADESTPETGVSGSYMNASIDVNGQDGSVIRILAGRADSTTVTAANNTDFIIEAEAFGTGDSRVTQVEIYDNRNVLVAHGNKSASVRSVVAAAHAGDWKIQTLFWDGTKAICTVTIAVQA